MTTTPIPRNGNSNSEDEDSSLSHRYHHNVNIVAASIFAAVRSTQEQNAKLLDVLSGVALSSSSVMENDNDGAKKLLVVTVPSSSSFTHPRDELVEVMSRIYSRTLTTSSGGNCSVKDVHGVVWITPKGNDKGALKRDEIAWRDAKRSPGSSTATTTTVTITPQAWHGNYPPSSEWPFHTAIFEARHDVGAVLHAHSHTLVAFSVAQKLPQPLSLSQTAYLCGRNVALAPYALPGTDALADTIVAQVHRSDCIIMENHGVVVVAPTMLQAFCKFEALEFCARAELGAVTLGGRKLLIHPDDLESQQRQSQVLPIQIKTSSSIGGSGDGGSSASRRPKVTPLECELRDSIVKYIRRSYEQGLIHATSGALSARLTPTSFLITATGVDRRQITARDIVLIDFSTPYTSYYFTERDDHRPSRAWAVHQALYQAFADTKSIVHAHPIHITSFCLSTEPFTPNVIPESYIVLRDVGRITFRQSFNPDKVVEAYRENSEIRSILLAENDGVIIRGTSLEQVFDRLEVLEATANVVLEAKTIGRVNLMTESQQDEVDIMFFGCKTPKAQPNKRQKHSHPSGDTVPGHFEFGTEASFDIFMGLRREIRTSAPSGSFQSHPPSAHNGMHNMFKGGPRLTGPLIGHKSFPS